MTTRKQPWGRSRVVATTADSPSGYGRVSTAVGINWGVIAWLLDRLGCDGVTLDADVTTDGSLPYIRRGDSFQITSLPDHLSDSNPTCYNPP